MPSGNIYENRADLMQATGCKILKAVNVPGEALKGPLVCIDGNEYRVLLEATDDIHLYPGHFIGRGGVGSFSVLEKESVIPGRMGTNAWTYSMGDRMEERCCVPRKRYVGVSTISGPWRSPNDEDIASNPCGYSRTVGDAICP